MGKKTNWTISEDQALCRAWLCASDGTLPRPAEGQKAGTFWGFVYQFFHAELETSVDRPLTGLKIRWTRINRDVQRFALNLVRVQATMAASRDSNASSTQGDRDPSEVEHERERRCLEQAAELFLKEQGNKFTFESCWRLLRYSPRWLQILANSGPSSGLLQLSSEDRIPCLANAGSQRSSAGLSAQKRRLATMMESFSSSQSLSESAMMDMAQELKRQSDLMEEQNAIALFQMELELIEDDVARDFFSRLRQSYVKRMRRDDADTAVEATTEAQDEEEEGEGEAEAEGETETKSNARAEAVALRDGKQTVDL